MDTSVDPVIDWQHDAGCAAHYDWLLRHGDRLVRWPAAPFEASHTDCFAVDGEYWIWQPGVGGIRFTADALDIEAFSVRGVDRDWFAYLVRRCWFPPVYQVRGRQVVHASAVVHRASGECVAFAGPSGAGKSTLAYGLGRRPGWQRLCDDTMALSASGGNIVLHPIDNESRLRPASASYFGVADRPQPPVTWPVDPVRLQRIYFLEPRADDSAVAPAVSITPLRPADSYRRLLAQAHALTLKIPALNQRLMLDYLAVAAATPACRLSYRRSFDHIDAIFDAVEGETMTARRPAIANDSESLTAVSH